MMDKEKNTYNNNNSRSSLRRKHTARGTKARSSVPSITAHVSSLLPSFCCCHLVSVFESSSQCSINASPQHGLSYCNSSHCYFFFLPFSFLSRLQLTPKEKKTSYKKLVLTHVARTVCTLQLPLKKKKKHAHVLFFFFRRAGPGL